MTHAYLNYMTALPLAHSTGAILLSQSFFDKLPARLSKLLIDEFEPAMADLTTDLRAQTKEAIGLLEKGGITIIPMPTGKDLEDFYKVHDEVAKDLMGKIYPKALLDRIYSLIGRTP